MSSKVWATGALLLPCVMIACSADDSSTGGDGSGGNGGRKGNAGASGRGGSGAKGGVGGSVATGGSGAFGGSGGVSGSGFGGAGGGVGTGGGAGTGGSVGTGGGVGTGGSVGTGGGVGTGGNMGADGGVGTGGTVGTGGSAGSAGKAGSAGSSGSGGNLGSGGVAGTGGTAGTDGGSTGPTPPIPTAPAQCPNIATGNITVMNQQVRLWVGPAGRPGPIVFYWHGTGSNSGEATGGLGSALTEITSNGGVVASFSTSTATGTNTGNGVWYTGDFAMADIILACAVRQGVADPRQIFTAGCSAGGLQASAMVYGRSSYLAGAMPNSGGNVRTYQLQDPTHVPAAITTHGGAADVVLGANFGETTARFTADIAAKGGFVVNCNHGGNHCASPAAVKTAQWQFLKAHPYKVSPEPYANGLPASFPTYCTIIRP